MICKRCNENNEYGVSYLVGTHNEKIWICKECVHYQEIDIADIKHCSNWGCNCNGWMEA
jgi:hypothetical protein